MKIVSWSTFFQSLLLQLGLKNQTDEDLAFVLGASEPQDWVKALELLHGEVRKKQVAVDALEIQDLTFDLIELSAYLINMDLCLSKNKKYYDTYKLREKSFNEIERQTQLEYMNASLHAQETHQTMRECIPLISGVPINNLHIKYIAKTLQKLEIHTRDLGKAIERLEDAVFKTGPLYQLFENDVFLALCEVEKSQIQLVPYGYTPLKESTNNVIPILREHAQLIPDLELKGIALGLINQYESLNRYMIFFPSTVLKTAFKMFYNNVDQFIKDILENPKIEEASLHQRLNSIFRAIESIRFIANKKDSFTKNLQDAAKSSKKQLFKHLEKTQTGQNFLNLYQRMSPKQKLMMRSRFK